MRRQKYGQMGTQSMTSPPTEMEERCAQAACCGDEPDGKCKRGPARCDAEDYLRVVRHVVRAMEKPTVEIMGALTFPYKLEDLNEGKRLQRELGTEIIPPSAQCEILAGLWSFAIRAASPPEGES